MKDVVCSTWLQLRRPALQHVPRCASTATCAALVCRPLPGCCCSDGWWTDCCDSDFESAQGQRFSRVAYRLGNHDVTKLSCGLLPARLTAAPRVTASLRHGSWPRYMQPGLCSVGPTRLAPLARRNAARSSCAEASQRRALASLALWSCASVQLIS